MASATEHNLTADKMTYIWPDERLLAQLETLHNAYTNLARLNGGDLDIAGDDAITMALGLLTPGADG
jgi:hypothetical protein